MKSLIIFLFLCITVTFVQAQDFDSVDQRVSLYPKHYNSANQLADQITKDFSNDFDKVRAIYTWLTLNISYDSETFYSGKSDIDFSYFDKEDLQRKLVAIDMFTVNKTLRTNKAVCEGYARTFKKVSDLLKIPCLFIDGYSKTEANDIGNVPKEGDHAWNAIRVSNTWYLIDTTWGAGYAEGDKWIQHFDDFFFLTDPDTFALTHYPSEKEFLFTKSRITKSQFYKAPIYDKAFFINDLKLLSPLKGELVVEPDQEIVFTMGVIPKDITLYYTFIGDNSSKKIEPNCANEKCTFKIPFVQNKNTGLLIFANEQTILHYKIRLKN